LEELLDWKAFCFLEIKDKGRWQVYSLKHYHVVREGGGDQTAGNRLELSHSSTEGRSAE